MEGASAEGGRKESPDAARLSAGVEAATQQTARLLTPRGRRQSAEPGGCDRHFFTSVIHLVVSFKPPIAAFDVYGQRYHLRTAV